ncbi:MAG: hypothetical protein HY854_10400 [Burkholderiales bacterium]|nr:hypothetical protein [Burkholderiales bacterium]
MSQLKKIAGLIVGVSTVAVIGVAVAQSVPPNPFVSNHAQGAGQQSTHITWMGETGTPWGAAPVVTAQAEVRQEAAVAPEPAPVVAQAEPAPQETQAMGAPPAPEPAPVAPKADRN